MDIALPETLEGLAEYVAVSRPEPYDQSQQQECLRRLDGMLENFNAAIAAVSVLHAFCAFCRAWLRPAWGARPVPSARRPTHH